RLCPILWSPLQICSAGEIPWALARAMLRWPFGPGKSVARVSAPRDGDRIAPAENECILSRVQWGRSADRSGLHPRGDRGNAQEACNAPSQFIEGISTANHPREYTP